MPALVDRSPKLPCPTDPSYLYEAEVRDVIDADTYCDQSQSIRP
jgi:hypothetical protein